MKVRLVFVVVVALLTGIVLGRLGSQDELQRMEGRLAGLQKELSGLRRASHPPPAAASRAAPRSLEREGSFRVRRSRMAADASTNGAVTASGETARPAMADHAARMREAWLQRQATARSNFLESAELDAQQTADFDTTIDAMNIRLGETVDKWAARFRDGESLPAENGLRMMSELSQAMILVYDDLDRRMPSDWRQKAGARFAPMTFVDPEVMTPLQGVGAMLWSQGMR